MTKLPPVFIRLGVTLTTCAVAALVGWSLWNYYMNAPWTRDGRVRADVVLVAPDVSGLVVQVAGADNKAVKAGEVIFEIDPSRYQIALDMAQAKLAEAQALGAQAKRDAARYDSAAANAVSTQDRQMADAKAEAAEAVIAEAEADVALARLNVARTKVRASVDGQLANFSMQPGLYVTAGQPVAALVATNSLYVDGYFEETKLTRIHVGDAAVIRLMGGGPEIDGHVVGIAPAIADNERLAAPTLLADVNPTFTWVRLAARVPVRIEIDHVPAGVTLVAGLTATVDIRARYGQVDANESP
jgi:RND family efflux transporter MFP subunit